MSGLRVGHLSASENEFLAEETMITIISAIDHPTFRFISGTYGPLYAGLPCDVPLWLAITLRKQGKCTIGVPDWMTPEALEQIIENEKLSDTFEEIPFYYIEIFQMLLEVAREDIPEVNKVGALIKDLENIRMDTARGGIRETAERIQNEDFIADITMTNIASAELYAVKGFIQESVQEFARFFERRETVDSRGSTYGSNALRDATPARNTPQSAPVRTLRRFRQEA